MNRNSIAALSVFLTLAAPVVALESDRDQPIHIEADSVTIDDQQQISRYRGNVTLRQGTLRASADEITLYTSSRGADRIVLVGKPATFRQRPEGKESDAEGSANRIEYDTDREVVLFSGDARFALKKEEFAGPRIEYDAKNDRVRATGSEDGGDRVRIVIQPKTRSAGEKP
ncbi:MAG: lipopolysaccharide ABC transporter substrate-binding protein LptA [Gammaproteobacteria bacterium]